MMHISSSRRKRIRQRTMQLRRVINAMDYVASGTLHTRTKVCGRSNCKCADDLASRHGPYFEWSRRKEGRLVHSVVPKEQAEWLKDAIANYRKIHRLLEAWEDETALEILKRQKIKEG